LLLTTIMTAEETSINIKGPVRDELRRYKAQDGLTYDEAVARLLAEADWISDEQELLKEL
jgi:hypothetical protein